MSRNLSSQPQDNSTWMVVYVTHDMQDAAIVAGRLKHEGIMATLDHMTEYDAIGIMRGNWGQSAMLVPPKNYVLAVGTIVWIVRPNVNYMEVHHPGRPVQILREDDVLNGGDLLPGFKPKISDILKP